MIRIFIVDDSVGFATLADAWLGAQGDLEVVGSASTSVEAIGAVRPVAPDVLLLDRLLPQPEHSTAVYEYVRSELPATAIVLLSGMPDEVLAEEAKRVGADGHVSKATDANGLVAAIRAAFNARQSLTP
jgi:DNA-binding NarL/FixJ family response regulator